ncbi:MAG TPA: MBL fold metallo-hydrolase [Dongiaceae bacterium]|jgi:glyoxylase-like metal-dependent hydrolase (beta-lactamase superfamily II)|nr:MBL fold metallo-hydrolase [Dongiaceae bacterium]
MSAETKTLDAPIMLSPHRLTEDWTMLPGWAPLPGLGVLAINSFLLKGPQPVLVDTGMACMGDAYLAALEREIDPAEIAWIWISHADADHIGNLQRVLERAPRARVVTAFIGMAKLGLMGFDLSRVELLRPGADFEAGGRRLHPLRPLYYDAPETTGFFDPAADLLFTVDSFGAVLPAPVATVEDAAPGDLHHGMVTWSSIDAPWLAQTDRAAMARGLAAIERRQPRHLISAHLPPLGGRVSTVTRPLAGAYGSGAVAPADGLAVETVLGALDRIAA